MRKAEAELGVEGDVRLLHYLSVPPKAALDVIHQLDEAGLVERSRIIMEKPFGTDLASAVALNAEVHEVFDEEQIFRIDHFLGKEAAQNILAFRFANGLFEPIWNRNFIDHVQIDVPETLGLEGRTAFYESTGAYRDMVVTHLMQVLAFMAMEPPTSLAPGPISDEKLKVFRSMRPIEPHDVVRGQYSGYRGKEEVADVLRHRDLHRAARSRSTTGAGPACRSSCAPARSSPRARGSSRSRSRSRRCRCSRPGSNAGMQGPDHLTFDLADQSRMSLSFYGKRPGPGMKLEKLSMQFATHETGSSVDVLEAYERLILDAMRGDHTLFTTADGIETLWEKSIPLLAEPAAGPRLLARLAGAPTRSTSWSPRTPGGCRSSGPGGTRTPAGSRRLRRSTSPARRHRAAARPASATRRRAAGTSSGSPPDGDRPASTVPACRSATWRDDREAEAGAGHGAGVVGAVEAVEDVRAGPPRRCRGPRRRR